MNLTFFEEWVAWKGITLEELGLLNRFNLIMGIVTIFGLGAFISVSIKFMQKRKGYKFIEAARHRRRNKKENLREYLTQNGILITEERQRILDYSLDELIGVLQDGTITPLQALQAYQAKSILVDDVTNCIVDFIDDVGSTLISLSKVTDRKKFPLYGVPISVKECLQLKNTDATAGLTKNLFKPSSKNHSLVQAMLDFGAVPFCKTNNPQMLKSFGCSNPIFGITTNPHNKNLTSGGSSGGEAALLALGGSILGIGSDIGGSLRIPAHFCGISSLKPTFGRLLEGESCLGKGSQPPLVYSTVGFMSADVDGMITVHKILGNHVEKLTVENHFFVPLKWNDDSFLKPKLKIGWYDYDEYFEADPSCVRAVRESVDRLSNLGYEMVRVMPPNTPALANLFLGCLFSDGGKHIFTRLDAQEPLDECFRTNYIVSSLPSWFKSTIVKFVLKYIVKSPHLTAVCTTGPRSAWDIWKFIGEMDTLKEEVFREWWNKGKLDAVLMPGLAFPAIRNAVVSRFLPGASYTAVFNILNYPAGVVPVTRVTDEDLEKLKDYPYKSHPDFLYDYHRKTAKEALNCPVGVQVVAKPWNEEMVLRVMRDIQG